MAREIDEILDGMITHKESEPSLDVLTSVSQTAVWRMILYICAVAIHNMEVLMDAYNEDIILRARTAISGTSGWWSNKMFEFQYSDTDPQQVVEIEPLVLGYPVIDESLRIITRAAVKERADRKVGVKIAKGDDDNLQALSTDELAAATSYVNDINFVGIPVEITSLDSDKVEIVLDIYYSGQAVLSVVQEEVEEAIVGYFKTMSSVDFDGVLNLNDLNSAILAVNGVVDTDSLNMVVNLRADNSIYGDSNNIIVNREQETFAGYAAPETTVDHTLADTITYILG